MRRRGRVGNPGRSWDEELFATVGDDYDHVFAAEVAETEKQAAFAARVLGLRLGQRVLDLCCGAGRHSLALARQGFLPTGVDREPRLLALARQRAAASGVTVQWVEADARRLPYLGLFHGALCLFASWGYAADVMENARVLGQVADRLLPGSRLLLDIPNVLWLHQHPMGHQWAVQGGTAVHEARRFNVSTSTLEVRWHLLRTGNEPWEGLARYRVLDVRSLQVLAGRYGLTLEAAYGDFEGRPLTSETPRALLLLRRTLPLGSARR